MSIQRQNTLEFRKKRVRKKVFGTLERPRLSVKRTLKHLYAQIVDDTSRKTLVFESTLSKELKGKLNNIKKTEQSKKVGELLAQKALEKKIKTVVFDRGGRKYHGRVKSFADGARHAGLVF
ncbi:MAG: 50S ribosomal protein L18 [Elusimicrobiota bacterium]